MIELIESYLLTLNKDLAVFIISIFPIVELRGAIPFGIGMGLHWFRVLALSVLGNMLPVPIVIRIVRPIVEWLINSDKLSGFGRWVQKYIMNKSRDVTKYKMLGLFLYVAIPLPGTGAWTGAMIAGLLDMRLKDSIPVIFLGVLVAGIIVTLVSCGFKFIF